MADGGDSRQPIKKVSAAWRKTRTPGSEKEQADNQNLAEGHLIEQYFGNNSLLFCFRSYVKENGMHPTDWEEFYEYLNYIKTTSAITNMYKKQAELLNRRK